MTECQKDSVLERDVVMAQRHGDAATRRRGARMANWRNRSAACWGRLQAFWSKGIPGKPASAAILCT